MKLRKNSWHYKWVYRFEQERPDRLSLCRYFWRLVGMSIFNGIVLAILAVIYIVCTLVFLANLLVYPRVFIFWDDSSDLKFKPIKWWPCVRGHTISPLLILAAISLYWVGPWFSVYFIAGINQIRDLSGGENPFFYVIIAVVSIWTVVGFWAFGIFGKIFATDGWKIFSGYMKAKWKRVCPIIDFVDDEEAG